MNSNLMKVKNLKKIRVKLINKIINENFSFNLFKRLSKINNILTGGKGNPINHEDWESLMSNLKKFMDANDDEREEIIKEITKICSEVGNNIKKKWKKKNCESLKNEYLSIEPRLGDDNYLNKKVSEIKEKLLTIGCDFDINDDHCKLLKEKFYKSDCIEKKKIIELIKREELDKRKFCKEIYEKGCKDCEEVTQTEEYKEINRFLESKTSE